MSDRLEEKLVEWDKDADFILEGVLLAVTEDICRLIIEKGYTPEQVRDELATRMGTSKCSATCLLQGRSRLTLKTLVRAAIALEEPLTITIPPSVSWERARAREAKAQAGVPDDQ